MGYMFGVLVIFMFLVFLCISFRTYVKLNLGKSKGEMYRINRYIYISVTCVLILTCIAITLYNYI